MENKLVEEIKKARREKDNRSFVNTFVKREDVKKLSSQKGYEKISEFLFVITNNIQIKPVCKECGESVEFISIAKGYRGLFLTLTRN